MIFPQHDILFSELWFRSEFPLDGSLIPRNTVFFPCQARDKPAWLPQSCLGESPWCLCLTSLWACAWISCTLWTASETCFVGFWRVFWFVFCRDCYWKRQKRLVPPHMVGIWFWLCGLHTPFWEWDLLLYTLGILWYTFHFAFLTRAFWESSLLSFVLSPSVRPGMSEPLGRDIMDSFCTIKLRFRVGFCLSY